MEPFNTPLKIREISLPHRAVFGPMAGFTDAPARRLMAQHGAGFTVSEMVSSRALVYGDHKTVSLLKAEPNGAPYGVQIFGEVPEIMGQASAAVEQYAFDFLDINMGCPAPKIVSGGAGSKLMLDITEDEGGKRRRLPLHVSLKTEEGEVLAEGVTPGPSDDMRKFLEITLPEKVNRGMLEFLLPDGTVRREAITHTEAPVQILNLSASLR